METSRCDDTERRAMLLHRPWTWTASYVAVKEPEGPFPLPWRRCTPLRNQPPREARVRVEERRARHRISLSIHPPIHPSSCRQKTPPAPHSTTLRTHPTQMKAPGYPAPQCTAKAILHLSHLHLAPPTATCAACLAPLVPLTNRNQDAIARTPRDRKHRPNADPSPNQAPLSSPAERGRSSIVVQKPTPRIGGNVRLQPRLAGWAGW